MINHLKFKSDKYNLLIIFGYVLTYLSLRLISSPYLDWDEAEQFVLAKTFNFGDARAEGSRQAHQRLLHSAPYLASSG